MQTDYTSKDIERFWGYVDKESSSVFYNGERCWDWIGNCFPNGYGQISIGGRSGKKYLGHRVSYELFFGEISGNLLVLHHCDNRRCVQPAHLFLGTHLDNTMDMIRKERQGHHAPKSPARGESHGMHKLTTSKLLKLEADRDLEERGEKHC
jgi:hypothetical protein